MKRLLMAAALGLGSLLATGGAGVPASAAAPTATAPAASTQSCFSPAFGASTLTGCIDWTNRSVQIGATLKAVSSPKIAEFVGFNGGHCFFDQTRFTAAGTSRGIGFSESCDQAGGFGEVDVLLEDGSGNILREDACFRTGCRVIL